MRTWFFPFEFFYPLYSGDVEIRANTFVFPPKMSIEVNFPKKETPNDGKFE